jgi:hypothetical protein
MKEVSRDPKNVAGVSKGAVVGQPIIVYACEGHAGSVLCYTSITIIRIFSGIIREMV